VAPPRFDEHLGFPSAKPLVLLLKLLEAPELITAHPAILLAPAIEADLADPELTDRVCNRHALAVQHLNLPKQGDDLLRLVTLPRHLRSSSFHNRRVDQFDGGGSLGLRWDESLPYTDPRNSETAMDMAPDRYRYVLEQPIVDAPGSRWAYNGGATALIARLISQGSGQSIVDFARERLFAPLGIYDFEWTADRRGEPIAASGLRLRPRDLAKIGQLILNGGAWGELKCCRLRG